MKGEGATQTGVEISMPVGAVGAGNGAAPAFARCASTTLRSVNPQKSLRSTHEEIAGGTATRGQLRANKTA